MDKDLQDYASGAAGNPYASGLGQLGYQEYERRKNSATETSVYHSSRSDGGGTGLLALFFLGAIALNFNEIKKEDSTIFNTIISAYLFLILLAFLFLIFWVFTSCFTSRRIYQLGRDVQSIASAVVMNALILLIFLGVYNNRNAEIPIAYLSILSVPFVFLLMLFLSKPLHVFRFDDAVKNIHVEKLLPGIRFYSSVSAFLVAGIVGFGLSFSLDQLGTLPPASVLTTTFFVWLTLSPLASKLMVDWLLYRRLKDQHSADDIFQG